MKNFEAKLNGLLFLAACGLGAWLLLTAAYSLRGDFRLGVGELADSPYLSGFNGDEAGTPRHRWTGGSRLSPTKEAVGVINIPWGLNPNTPSAMRIDLLGLPGQPPPTVEVRVNGVTVGQTRPDPGAYKTVEFSIPAGMGGDSTRIEIVSPAIKLPSDSRYLGVQVAEVKLLSKASFRRPPLDAFGWGWLYALAVGLILLRWAGAGYLLWSAGAGVATLIPWLLLPLLAPDGLNLWYVPFWLPGLTLIAGLIAFFLYWRLIRDWLLGGLARLESSPSLARNILLVVLLLYSLYALNIVLKMDYIGHADYADNAVAARNIVEGRGYSLDYAAQFYQRYSLPRPADTWPPLQPFLIVPFYAVFGPTVWAAKLPNLLLVPTLAWLIFVYGSRLFDRRVGLLAAGLSLFAVMPAFSAAPALFETIAYPINDLVFSLLSLCLLLEVGFLPGRFGPGTSSKIQQLELPLDDVEPLPGFEGRVRAWLQKPSVRLALVGGLAGLLFLSKPSGTILLAAAGIWLLWHKYLARSRFRLSWPSLLTIAGIALLVISPFLIRNLLQWGTLYRSTEQYDSWVTKWNPPDEHIYDLYSPQNLPAPRQLLEYGWDNLFNAVNNQFRRFLANLTEGQLFAPLILALAGLGIFGLPRRLYRLAALLGLVGLVYVVFFLVYWHYEARYFLAWLPLIYLLGVYGLVWLYDKIKGSAPGAAVVLIGLVVVGLVGPNLTNLVQTEGPGYTTGTGIVATAEWLKANTPADAVIMSRNVWELSFHSRRQSVMIPNNASLDQIKGVMRDYHATYLELDHLDSRSLNEVWGQRRDLWDLLDRPTDYKGFKLVYDTGGLVVYQWNGR